VVKRAISLLLALLAAVAGLVALSYTLEGVQDLKFFKDNPLGGALGVLVPGVLCASAVYMAVRFFKGARQRPAIR
jgi:hypothetical protein